VERIEPYSLAEYLYSMRRSVDRSPRPVGACPNCRRQLDDVLITYRRRVGCRHCIPKTRECARCEKPGRLSLFDVHPDKRLGFKIDSYCVPCRRARMRDFYEVKKEGGNPAVSKKTCASCCRTKAARYFYRDGRYAEGLEPNCRQCKNAERRP
jgi:hypothetical protein